MNSEPLSQVHVLEMCMGNLLLTVYDTKLFLKCTWFVYVSECGVKTT